MTDLDTAINYRHYTAHRRLAETAGDLLGHFDITTKIGFFPDGHDLSAARLRTAAESVCSELGRAPDTLLLHNPERAPTWFTNACHTMTRLRDDGLCRAWGISTWDPTPLLGRIVPAPPDVLMVRAGLLVPAGVLDAAEQIAEQIRPGELCGMAPLGGHGDNPIWEEVDAAALFLASDQQANRLQAAVATAFALPAVAAIAAGTGNQAHLAELAAAVRLDVNTEAIEQYRTLIRQRASVAHTSQGAS